MPHYPNAQIEEAVIAVSVASDEGEASRFEQGPKGFRVAGKIIENRFEAAVDSHPPTVTQQLREVGFRFQDLEARRIFQARDNALVYSVMDRYDRWPAFVEGFSEIWDWYRDARGEDAPIARVGVRFRNRIRIGEGEPPQRVELSDYVHVAPSVPDILEPMYESIVHIKSPVAGHRCRSNLTVKVNADSEERVWLHLDIDVFDLIVPADPRLDILARLGPLRDAKNAIFEKCITDRTRGLIS